MKPAIRITSACLLALPFLAQAQDGSQYPDQETVELPDLEVMGEKQELALRFIKTGLESDRSNLHEDRNKPYCWFDKATGSHMTYLYCGLNRALNAESRYWESMFTNATAAAGSLRDRRHVYRSQFPVNRARLEKLVDRLGPSALNEEILARGLRGEAPPDDVPSTEEVDRFARALAQVRAIRDGGDRRNAESRMVAAIQDAGLTIDRYNQISDLVERYESLREMVKERL